MPASISPGAARLAPKAGAQQQDGRTPSRAHSRCQYFGAQPPGALRQREKLRFAPRTETASFDILMKLLPDAGMGPPGAALAHGFASIPGDLSPVPAPRKDPQHGVDELAIGDGAGLPRFRGKKRTKQRPFLVRELALSLAEPNLVTILCAGAAAGGQDDDIRVNPQRLQFLAAVQ